MTCALPPEQLPQVDDVYRQLLQMNQQGFPVVDYHTHLKGGLTLEQALANSRRLGIMYGIAVNGGLKFPITNGRRGAGFPGQHERPALFYRIAGGRPRVGNPLFPGNDCQV